ncbi:MAG: hypothetical protein K1X53_05720 [Candidatus Sumerlaeaceae bacterium]|nr:hypothetical protein [Candidatus Sumerlaeaceae bacterium]
MNTELFESRNGSHWRTNARWHDPWLVTIAGAFLLPVAILVMLVVLCAMPVVCRLDRKAKP